ncbi:MAG: hypothetical protein FWG90_11590 [Oscillospiraceae bacterium]|nr:hypothetical protein [Oscillospiraceae bacterium]
MKNRRTPKLKGHNPNNDFLFKKISDEAYSQLFKLESTPVQIECRFNAAREEAGKITETASERDRNKKPGEINEIPKSDMAAVQFLFGLNDEEYSEVQKAAESKSCIQQKECYWLNHCCNIGLLPFDKNTPQNDINFVVLKVFHSSDYNTSLTLTSVEFVNPKLSIKVLNMRFIKQ